MSNESPRDGLPRWLVFILWVIGVLIILFGVCVGVIFLSSG